MQLTSFLTVVAALKATTALPLVSDNDHTHIPGAGKGPDTIDQITGEKLNGKTVAQYGTFLCEGPSFLGDCIHSSSSENQCVQLDKGVSSVAPDKGVHCRYFYTPSCLTKEPNDCGYFDLTNSGIGNVPYIPENCTQDPTNKIRSYWCGPASGWI
ncbi:hypothetical protein B0T20DRAFT_182842 [Sordaria brevicollis]|uniref:Uncharacterized protein n=1 Tax=Sordaria brevicollis TaxID=83679 RepID=A0AAE0PID9_SORBR|nr:hypothetical protein B0T20DRAFT_182842 [Sordaria brevicollis]